MMAPTVESNPFTSLGFRLVTKVSLISNFRSSRDLHLFSIAVGASQSAANDWKACSTSGAFLFGERYATRSTNNSFSNEAENDHRKNPEFVPSDAAELCCHGPRERWSKIDTLHLQLTTQNDVPT